jgi:hypothetical protein
LLTSLTSLFLFKPAAPTRTAARRRVAQTRVLSLGLFSRRLAPMTSSAALRPSSSRPPPTRTAVRRPLATCGWTTSAARPRQCLATGQAGNPSCCPTAPGSTVTSNNPCCTTAVSCRGGGSGCSEANRVLLSRHRGESFVAVYVYVRSHASTSPSHTLSCLRLFYPTEPEQSAVVDDWQRSRRDRHVSVLSGRPRRH